MSFDSQIYSLFSRFYKVGLHISNGKKREVLPELSQQEYKQNILFLIIYKFQMKLAYDY